MHQPIQDYQNQITRRHFFSRAGIATAALSTLLGRDLFANDAINQEATGRVTRLPHFAPKARRVIYLFQSGGPSQLDLLDPKPQLKDRFGDEVPTSVYPDERKTTMSNAQSSFATAPSIFKFNRYGKSGLQMSELLANTAKMADKICIINSMHTQAINHDPAITMMQTGSQVPGRPSIGSWLSYGLGSETSELPAFVAMSSRGSGKAGQPLYDRLWGSGFLPSVYQGVKFRNQGAPVLDIYDPPGVDASMRRTMLDHLSKLNEIKYAQSGDKEIQTRIAQYELAGRMQASVPELLDFSQETKSVMQMYGPQVRQQGTFAHNCLIARRLAERGVRFIQLFHQGWDQHVSLPGQLRKQCRDTDQPTAALLHDLEARGMLDDTLIVWGGEFGRTVYSQGNLTKASYGRDHHGNCYSVWLAGAGIQGGIRYGKTDDYSVNVVENGMEPHDLNATILHQLGIDHERLIYPYQGRDFRLTDVHGRVVKEILA
ncbi:MAG: DUF1501 domain-containing protein [Mariniblastus sp.]|nr:DUF1501 domain-containing protein [Mariniblastus sp.]